jgi:hypothetical protein
MVGLWSNKVIVESPVFTFVVILAILVAGALVGAQTYPAYENQPIIDVLNYVVQCIFTMDCIARILRQGIHPHLYW